MKPSTRTRPSADTVLPTPLTDTGVLSLMRKSFRTAKEWLTKLSVEAESITALPVKADAEKGTLMRAATLSLAKQ